MNKRELQYQQTLESIRNSVDEIIVKEGFDKLTIRGVCQKAGIKHGSFYHYFKSKDDLIIDRQKRFNTFFEDLYENSLKGLDSIEALKLYTTEYFKYIETRVQPMLISFEKTLLSKSAEGKLDEYSAQKILRKLIRGGIETGEISSRHNPDELYNYMQILFLGIRIRYCHTAGESLPDEYSKAEIFRWIDSLIISN